MIQWNDRYSVNIADIDQQHQKLFNLIGELSAAMKKSESNEILGRILDGLIEYAGSHFTTEERLFDEYDYPQKAEHKAKHDDFVQKISECNDHFRQGRNMVSVQLIGFLSDWMVKHIMKEDQQYAKFFAEIKAPCMA